MDVSRRLPARFLVGDGARSFSLAIAELSLGPRTRHEALCCPGKNLLWRLSLALSHLLVAQCGKDRLQRLGLIRAAPCRHLAGFELLLPCDRAPHSLQRIFRQLARCCAHSGVDAFGLWRSSFRQCLGRLFRETRITRAETHVGAVAFRNLAVGRQGWDDLLNANVDGLGDRGHQCIPTSVRGRCIGGIAQRDGE